MTVNSSKQVWCRAGTITLMPSLPPVKFSSTTKLFKTSHLLNISRHAQPCSMVLQSRRNLESGQIPSMNPLDEAAKDSSAHTGHVPSARDDYAVAAPLQVVVDPQISATLLHCYASRLHLPASPPPALPLLLPLALPLPHLLLSLAHPPALPLAPFPVPIASLRHHTPFLLAPFPSPHPLPHLPSYSCCPPAPPLAPSLLHPCYWCLDSSAQAWSSEGGSIMQRLFPTL